MGADEKVMKPVTCATCGAAGEFPHGMPGGYLWQKETKDWYFSDNDDCFYCRPCNGKMMDTLLGSLFSLCKEGGTKVMDFDGNELTYEDGEIGLKDED